jgi:hypothetical protein
MFKPVVLPLVPCPMVATWGEEKGVNVLDCKVTALVLTANVMPPTLAAFAAA